MKPSEIIRGAMDLIPDEESWWRGSIRDPKVMERHCVVTALDEAADNHLDALTAAERFVAAESPVQTFLALPEWNDDPQTSFLDLRLVLKRALARAEESDV